MAQRDERGSLFLARTVRRRSEEQSGLDAMTPPTSIGSPRASVRPSGPSPALSPEPPHDLGNRPSTRGRWTIPLVEAAARSIRLGSGPPTEPIPVAGAPVPSVSGPRLPHLRALDGLRGVAVVAVVVYHFAPRVAPGGFLGVDLFFVLSGFLITSLLVNEWDKASRISLSTFWGRRARRLLPALFLVLAAVGTYSLLVGSRVDGEHVAQDGLSAFTYVANWHFISSGQSYIQQFVHSAPSPLRHMWSLAIEEQFYLIWPLLVVLVAKVVPKNARRPGRRRSHFRRVVVTACVGLGVLSLVRMITLYHPGGDVNRVYYGTDSRAFIILIGAALGALSMGVPTITRRRSRAVLIACGCVGAIGLVAAVVFTTTNSSYLYEGAYGAVALVMVVVLAAAAQPGKNPLARILETRTLVGLGLISYGVYLWHWPVSIWVTSQNTGVDGVPLFFVRSAITLAAALASYFLVEQPIRQGRLPGSFLKNPGVVPMGLVTAVAVVLLIPAIAFPSVAAVPKKEVSSTSAVAVTARYAAAPRCDGHTGSQPLDPGHLLRVQLFGNSISQEVMHCLGTILHARGAVLEAVKTKNVYLCPSLPNVEAQVRNSATHPAAAILFGLLLPDPACGPNSKWYTPVQKLVAMWESENVHVYLVPPVPSVPGSPAEHNLRGTGTEGEAAFYQTLANQDPVHVTVLDAGTFLHTDNGQYVWRMPCLGHEPGCNTHSVGVRWTDGFHYCTDPAYAARGCPQVGNQAGERRAAAAIATGLLPRLQVKPGASSPSG